MDDKGRTPIVETLLALESERRTGVLSFCAEGISTRIFLEGGTPVFAEAGSLGETLGNVLVRERIITGDQFAAVVRKMTDAIVDDENVRFGEVVVELGILTEQELQNALATQIERKIIGCVPRGVGEWSFEARDLGDVTRHPSPLRALLVDAAKLLSEQRVEALLALDRETFPCALQSAARIAKDYGLEDAEVGALKHLDGTRTTKSLVDAETPALEGYYALLCALVMGGSVELLAEKGAKAPPKANAPIMSSGRHRAVRVTMAESGAGKVVLEPRMPSLPPARNDREATLFSEDEFQSGKRLFAEGRLGEAHVQLVLACERSPSVPLYRLYEQFVGSRAKRAFADAAATKALAVQIVKEDAECAFAYHVLGTIALEEGSIDAAKRFFKHAFRLDPEMLDAGRQARALEKRDERALRAPTPFRDIVPMRRPARATPSKPNAPDANARVRTLLLILAAVTLGTIGIIAYFLSSGAPYREVR